MSRYVLIDSSQHPGFDRKLQQCGVLYRSLFEGHAEASLTDIAPLLIDVTVERDATEKVIDETQRIGKLKPCVSTLESELPLVPLAEHFTQFHLVETADGQAMLMRWYDTRILPIWLDVLSEEQRRFFTGSVTRWISIDRFGVEQEHISSKLDTQASLSGHTPLRLDERQAEQLFEAAEPDVLIFELHKALRAELDRIPQSVLYPFVQAHWRMAREHGLNSRSDQLLLLTLALRTSGTFIKHPRVKALFASPSATEPSFSQRFDALPESVWTSGKPLWDR